MKKIKIIACIMLICLLGFAISAVASEVMPCADTEFASAYPSLYTSKSVKFSALTNAMKGSISVTECWLEVYMSGRWQKVKDLTPPSKVAYSTTVYNDTVSYVDKIGSGTFRVWATFNADGHEITRCSNERTY